MKSEHRRDLHANELEKLTETVGKFFEQHGSKVLMGIGAAIVIGIGAYFAMNWGSETAEEASGQVYNAEAAGDFLRVADDPDFKGLPLKTYARLVAAEQQLIDAQELYIVERDGGLKDLKEVKQNFETVLAAKGLTSDAKERAMLGLARCLETMCDGDTSAAVTAYEDFLKEFPDTKWKKITEDRIAALKTTRAKELYAFLATSDRKPGDRKLPADIERLRKIRGHESLVPGGEKPVELPPIPRRLRTDLNSDSEAKPFRTKEDGKKKTGTTKAPVFPSGKKSNSTPGKSKTGEAKPFRAPDSKTGVKKTAPK